MNRFEKAAVAQAGEKLVAVSLDTIQVNVGLRCNQQCAHCHLECGPDRTEMMDWPTMEMVVEAAGSADVELVDITGGAPELNEHLPAFIKALRRAERAVQVRTNLTVLLDPDQQDVIKFFRDQEVAVAASLPCYLAENVDAQRGDGVFRRSIAAMRRLNAVGYGRRRHLRLDLVHNPGGAELPGSQAELEERYRKQLGSRFGVYFSNLRTITNVPIGRFGRQLRDGGDEGEYVRELERSFNGETLDGLMCRHQINVGWDGTLYDCDFNLAAGRPVEGGAPDHISRFESAGLAARQIQTAPYCFACTAGSGSSCHGAIV